MLFCIYKLQQNPDLTIRELKPEADLHQIPMAGRALHSAKGLLGLLKEAPSVQPAAPIMNTASDAMRHRRERRAAAAADDGSSIEETVLAAVRQIQSSASQQTDQLRAAVRQAIAILQRALGD